MNEVYDKIKGHAVTQPDAEPNSLQNTIAEILRAEFDEAGPDDMVTYLKIQSQLIAGAIVRQIYTAPPRPAQSDALMAARDEIISLLPQDWFENGFLKEPHPVIDKIDIALAALPRPSDRSRK